MIPYFEGIELAESERCVMNIYILKNPTNNEIFYVGKTSKDLKTRLLGHISDTGKDTNKGRYLKNILESTDDKPIIESIEIIPCICYVDKLKASEREYFWMKYYHDKGCPLTNYLGIESSPNHSQYEIYLKSIAEGRVDIKFYYCGKTKYGINVFDEEKMNEDGFTLKRNISQRPDDEDTYVPTIIYDEKFYDDNNESRASFEEI